MVNAFAKPVKPEKDNDGDLILGSIQRLCTEVDSIQRSFGLSVSRRLWFCQDRYDQRPESDCVVCSTLPELLQAVAATGE